MLRRRVVPRLARRRLVVPHVFAGVRLQRDDRREIEIVAAARAAQPLIPRGAIADADVEQVEFGVVGERVPHRAAAAELPPFAGPRLRRAFHRRRFEPLRGIAGDGVEAPRQLAGGGLVGGHVAAHAVLAAAVADDDLALHDARRAGDGVVLRLIDGDRLPQHLAALGVERGEPSVERPDVDAAVVQGDAPIDDVAARLLCGRL